MERIFMEEAKKNFCPDEIRPHFSDKIDQIRKEYDLKFHELIRWFWTEVDQHTTNQEKRMLYGQLSDSVREDLMRIYDKK